MSREHVSKCECQYSRHNNIASAWLIAIATLRPCPAQYHMYKVPRTLVSLSLLHTHSLCFQASMSDESHLASHPKLFQNTCNEIKHCRILVSPMLSSQDV